MASVLFFAFSANALVLNPGELFEFVKVSPTHPEVAVTSDGQGSVLIVDAELAWGQAPLVTFDNNKSQCLVESIEVNKVNEKTMNYWIKIRATTNTDFGGCDVKIKTYENEYVIKYGFWTS